MKTFMLVITLLTSVLTLQAQSQQPKTPSSSTRTTKPGTTTAPSGRTQATRPTSSTGTKAAEEGKKRQQQYDELHGVKKNGSQPTATKTPPRTVRREAVAPARNQQATTVTRSPATAKSSAAKSGSRPATAKPAPSKATAATPAKQPSEPKVEKPADKPPVVTKAPVRKTPVRVVAEPKVNRHSPTDVTVGLRIGANTQPNQIADPIDIGFDAEVESVIGYSGGVMVNLPLSESFSIQPEVLYSIRRARANVFGNFVEVRYNLLEVPLLLKYSFGNDIRFFVNAGPYGAYALKGMSKGRFSGQSFSRPVNYGDGSEGRFEYGATGGIGVVVPVGGSSVLVEGRYTRAFGMNLDPKPRQYPQILTLAFTYILPW